MEARLLEPTPSPTPHLNPTPTPTPNPMQARLLERGLTSGRSDDNLESIRKRFRTFKVCWLPLLTDSTYSTYSTY